jgi:hypothetical protein
VDVERVAALRRLPGGADVEAGVSWMWTCWSGLSETPPPMIVKFSFWFDPGVCASMKAVRQGRRSP